MGNFYCQIFEIRFLCKNYKWLLMTRKLLKNQCGIACMEIFPCLCTQTFVTRRKVKADGRWTDPYMSCDIATGMT